jgi:chromosome segregation ATPase
MVEDDKNWRSAMGRLGELFEAAIQAEKLLAEIGPTLRAKQEDIERLEQNRIETQRRLNEFKSELQARERERGKIIADLDEQITAKKAELAETTAAVDELKNAARNLGLTFVNKP